MAVQIRLLQPMTRYNFLMMPAIFHSSIKAVCFRQLLCYPKVGDDILSKYCDRCHKRLRIGQICKCSFARYNKKATEEFYKTSNWVRARAHCIELCCGLDLYSLFVYKTIEYGRTVHHIVPLKKNPSLSLEQSNLIYLTDANHSMIHEMYKSQYQQTVELLTSIKAQFVEGVGLYEKLFSNPR